MNQSLEHILDTARMIHFNVAFASLICKGEKNATESGSQRSVLSFTILSYLHNRNNFLITRPQESRGNEPI